MTVTLVGWALVAGFLVFLTGAVAWRPAYQQPIEESLPVMYEDRRRLRWIHWWMVPGVVTTTSGLGGLAWLVSDAGASVAAYAFAFGAVLWVGALLFRLSVGEWAAERTSLTGSVPELYPPFARWAGHGHAVHMTTAYLSAIPLAISVAEAQLIPNWLAWAGSAWGVILTAVFLAPSTRWVASPPILAHLFTFAVGVTLLI